jgi:hypothetical protein
MAQVEFRTGIREVPEHLAALMHDIETWRLTYEEAIEKANWKMAADVANKAQAEIIRRTVGR